MASETAERLKAINPSEGYTTDVFAELLEKGSSRISLPVRIAAAEGEFIPIPNVGDIIDCEFDEKIRARQVLLRYFVHVGQHCSVFLTVGDIERNPVTGEPYGTGSWPKD